MNINKREITEQPMLKYLADLLVKFRSLREGIERNENLWKALGISPQAISEHIDELLETGSEIEVLKETLSAKLAEARELRDKKRRVFDQFEKRVIGLHADSTGSLADYGMGEREK
jgi:biotin operon repressor